MDIDGDMRSATTPDIGADEYTPKLNDVAAIEILYPDGCATATDTSKACSTEYRTDSGNFFTCMQLMLLVRLQRRFPIQLR